MQLDVQRIDIGPTVLAVHDSGGDGDEAIVFLHGNLSRWQHWAPQLIALGDEIRCIAFDQRGFGASELDPPPSSAVALAGDVAALCHELGVTRAHVVGLSLGGVIAQAVAVLQPHVTASLVAASTYRLDEPHPIVAAFNAKYGGAVPELAAIGPMVRAMSFSDQFQGADPETVERVVAELQSTDQATFEATAGILDEAPLVAAPKISAPTLVIGAVHDQTAPPEVTRHLADAIPGAHYELLDTGHMSNLEAPDRFTALVRQHVGV
ncbi:MAG: alpha/beta fold hydrolase [Acidimicrobiales bacterium]